MRGFDNFVLTTNGFIESLLLPINLCYVEHPVSVYTGGRMLLKDFQFQE